MDSQINNNVWCFPQHGDIFDVGGSKSLQSIEEAFEHGLRSGGPLPKSILYALSPPDLWQDVSKDPAYYQTVEELAIFDAHREAINLLLFTGMTIVDLGAGASEKAEWFLNEVARAGIRCTYIAVDINRSSLARTIPRLAKEFCAANIHIIGIYGSFLNAMEYCKQIPGSRLFLSLGSSTCNKPRKEAVEDLQGWSNILRNEDVFLFGQDAHALDDEKKIESAYHSPPFMKFIKCFIPIANEVAGEEVFSEAKWGLECSLSASPTPCHVFKWKAKEDVPYMGHTYAKGTAVNWFESYKYSQQQVYGMCHEATLQSCTISRERNSPCIPVDAPSLDSYERTLPWPDALVYRD
ncbi:hypothetical protein AUP68_06428 [Ilyonectria robusta]